jgi:hypothetical protein
MKIRAVGAELFRADKQTDGKTGGGTDGRTDRHEKNLRVEFCTLRTRQKLYIVTAEWMFVFCMNLRTNNFYTTLTD